MGSWNHIIIKTWIAFEKVGENTKSLIYQFWPEFSPSVKNSCRTNTLLDQNDTLLKTDPTTPLNFPPCIATGKMLLRKLCHRPTFSSLNFDHAHGIGLGDLVHGDIKSFSTLLI